MPLPALSEPLSSGLVVALTAAALIAAQSQAARAAEPAFAGAPKVVACAEAPTDMACVAGGPFLRGTDKSPRHARPQETVWVQTFYMDVYEVTVAQYEACVASGKCKKARTIYSDYSRPKQPKVGMSWHDAVTFCEAMGKHLPTEAQWEKAARGADGRRYPWGNEPATCRRAVIKDRRGRSCGVNKRGRSPDKGRTFVVGTRPPNPYGLYDMAGNAWEYVYDWFTPNYTACGDACRGVEPRGPCDGALDCPGMTRRIVRGGSWFWSAGYATTFRRRPHEPTNTDPYHHFGFRCAASVERASALVSPSAP